MKTRKGLSTPLALFEIKNLHVAIEDGTKIVRGVDLTINPNEIHAVMGPNGSGKSTLAYALMGHPAYEITEGEILLDGENLVDLEADERAQRGPLPGLPVPARRSRASASPSSCALPSTRCARRETAARTIPSPWRSSART